MNIAHLVAPASPSSMPMCKMYMLWNWETVNTCVVFRSWHVTSNTTFVLSFFAIVLIGVLFEWVREIQKSYDKKLALALTQDATPLSARETPGEQSLLLGRGTARESGSIRIPGIPRLIRAGLYGLSCFISFFIMLIFMTYNGYLIGAVVVGAATGHWIFGGQVDVDDIVLSGGSLNGKAGGCH